VPVEEELRRVGPVLQALAGRLRIPLSIDTSHAAVARLALDQGASVVNDVTAGREDPRLWPLVAERRAGLVLMHMRGTPADMQRDPRYADVTAEVAALLRDWSSPWSWASSAPASGSTRASASARRWNTI
jgi:dihydropteroate synthase